MEITGKDNPKVKMYRRLASSRKYREETGLFVIEGMRSCVDAVKECLHGILKVEMLFVTDEAQEKYSRLLDTSMFDKLDKNKVFIISNEVAQKMTDERSSQGAFAIARKLDKAFDGRAVRQNGKYLVADGLQDPGNLGTLLRTADAVGIDGVVLCRGVDLYNPKVVRAAMGSMPRINIYIENDFEKLIKAFQDCKIKTVAAVVSDGISITDYDFSCGCAVVIGNEGRGLSDEHISFCDDKITIMMRGNIDSLNAASAGTIFLWEMTR